MNRLFLFAIIPLIPLFCSGCGPKEVRLPVFPTSGKVLVDGKPAAGVMVAFHPTDPKNTTPSKPNAVTGKDGTYSLTTYEKLDGAPAGDYTVTLLWYLNQGEENGITDRFQGAFANPSNTRYKTTVREQPNNTFNIDIKFEE